MAPSWRCTVLRTADYRGVVQARMNLTGACWSLAGAEAILRPRAIRAKDDLDAYWRHHLDPD
jgi:hypothetical protein